MMYYRPEQSNLLDQLDHAQTAQQQQAERIAVLEAENENLRDLCGEAALLFETRMDRESENKIIPRLEAAANGKPEPRCCLNCGEPTRGRKGDWSLCAHNQTEPAIERCKMCRGSGELWTECCNGSSGCDCQGREVYMGPCRECDGRGEIPAGSAVPYRQSATHAYMQSASSTGYVGSGPYGRTR